MFYGNISEFSLKCQPLNEVKFGYKVIKKLKTNPNHIMDTSLYTVHGLIFMDTNFRGMKKNETFVGFKIHGNCIFLHYSY